MPSQTILREEVVKKPNTCPLLLLDHHALIGEVIGALSNDVPVTDQRDDETLSLQCF